MTQTQGPATFAAAQKTSTLIWLALSGIVFIYGGLLVFMSRNSWQPGGKEVQPMMQWALAAVGLVTAGMSMYFHRVRFSPENVAARAGGDEAKAAGEFQAGHISAWSMADATAIYGLVLSFIGQQLIFFLPFALVALILLAAERPDVEPYRRAFEEGR